MEFGITGIENAPAAARMGYDYLEVNASGIEKLPEEGFRQELARIQACGLPAPCCNVLFHDIALLTDEGLARVEAYLRPLFGRLQRIGVRLAVFGSGAARRKPEGMPYGDAWRRLREVAYITGSVAGEFGIQIAIEPLCRAETDMVNTVAEGAALASAVDLPNLWVLADSYHMFVEEEPVSSLLTVGGLSHVHVALRDGRSYPTYAEGRMRLFMDALHKIGYNGRVTIEAGTRDFAHDAPLALDVLRSL